MLQTQRTQAQKLQGIAIDMDEEVLRQLLLEEKLTIDHFRCVDTESKHAIRKLFLWVLDQRLNASAANMSRHIKPAAEAATRLTDFKTR